MSALVMPKSRVLTDLNAKTALAAYATAKLNLYSNNLTPTPLNVLADFTPCVFSGYAPAVLTWSPAFYDGDGNAVSSGGETLFTQTGATPDFCYGAFLTDNAGAVLLWSARLDVAPFNFVVSGDTLPLVVLMGLIAGKLLQV
jgi:hypothetical protein